MNLSEAIAWAEKASPKVAARSTQKWAGLFPVYQKLRANGFSVAAAVEAMREKKLIPAGSEKRATSAFSVLQSRRNKKAKTQTA